MTPQERIAYLKTLPPDEMRVHLRALPKDELILLLRSGLADLHKQISRIPELILEGMETKLPTHQESKAEADALMARLTGKRA